MSKLDLSSQMPFADAQGLEGWFLDHAQSHAQYESIIYQAFLVQIPAMDLMDDGAMKDWIEAMKKGKDAQISPRLNNWLYAHSQLHQAELDILGDIAPVDIDVADFRDASEFYSWMYDHQQIHDAVDAALGTS